MDSQRVLGHLNIHKRKLSNDDVHDFIDEDLKACKYAKVAEGKESLISCNSEIGTGSSGHLRGTVVQQDAFKRSAVPLQVLYYHKGQWKEFSQDLLPMITQSFTSREACIKFSVANKLYALYFVHMIQVNLYTGFVRSIAWIDSNGHRFFPCRSVEQSFYGYVANLLPRRDSLTVKSDVQQRDLDDIHRMSNLDVSKHVMTSNCSGFAGLGGKLIQLDVSDDDYSFVRDKLLSGLSMLVKGATITGVYENSHAGVSGQAKLQAFSMQESVTKMARGDANIRYAWHGTSKDGVLGILRYGFGQPRVPRNGDAYGVGVYLAPEDSSHVSVMIVFPPRTHDQRRNDSKLLHLGIFPAQSIQISMRMVNNTCYYAKLSWEEWNKLLWAPSSFTPAVKILTQESMMLPNQSDILFGVHT
ncbi:hypothetical protein KP509_03G015900 [Ceratopteris richardii]|uniref:Poly [ADP-ribose] polymerase n=1 Tax=Ceratopteris richardii TaxID=49495 RepID=A0A8T2V0H7_CERRI|nr:hypothetical protein KP509_03G015900 [Ceratopteris richardii]